MNCLRRRVPRDDAKRETIEAWLRADGWAYRPRRRLPWIDPNGSESWALANAARGHAEVVGARLLIERGWLPIRICRHVFARPPTCAQAGDRP